MSFYDLNDFEKWVILFGMGLIFLGIVIITECDSSWFDDED